MIRNGTVSRIIEDGVEVTNYSDTLPQFVATQRTLTIDCGHGLRFDVREPPDAPVCARIGSKATLQIDVTLVGLETS